LNAESGDIQIKNNIEKVELAKAYVALSNAHQLSLVNQMFAEHASYDSTGVGLFEGRDAIANMMNGFFSQYPDVHWEARNYHCDTNQSVLFDFKMTATHANTGEKIYREGAEQISFSEQGLISRLEVKAI
jgi:hypothetical protein